MNQKTIAIVGPGKLGRVLASAWKGQGYTIQPIGRNDNHDAGNADYIAITTRDNEIEAAAQQIARQKLKKGVIAFHCSGSQDSGILNSLRQQGAKTASIHPLQTFPDLSLGLQALRGTYWFCEGDKAALDEGRILVESLGGQMRIIDPAQKVAYHAAVCAAANYMTSMIGLAELIGGRIGLNAPDFREAMAPILKATLDNNLRLGPHAALTGPVKRGDVQTLQNHYAALANLFPDSNDLESLYKALAEFTKNYMTKPANSNK